MVSVFNKFGLGINQMSFFNMVSRTGSDLRLSYMIFNPSLETDFCYATPSHLYFSSDWRATNIFVIPVQPQSLNCCLDDTPDPINTVSVVTPTFSLSYFKNLHDDSAAFKELQDVTSQYKPYGVRHGESPSYMISAEDEWILDDFEGLSSTASHIENTSFWLDLARTVCLLASISSLLCQVKSMWFWAL